MSYTDFDFPHTSLYTTDLREIISNMRKLEEVVKNFVNTEKLVFADPITWNITKQYTKGTIVVNSEGNAYVSKEAVPIGITLDNEDYWLEIFNFIDYIKSFNSNLTFNIETNTNRATHAYNIDDWLLWNDLLYKVISEIRVDDLIIIDSNIERFTVEEFCRHWQTYMVNTIQQYKDDIDNSELQYKNQIDASEATYQAAMQAEVNRILAGVTADSEVIDARYGANGVNYPTLGNAIRSQLKNTDYSYSRFNTQEVTDLFNPATTTDHDITWTPSNHNKTIAYSGTTTGNSQFYLNPEQVYPFKAGMKYHVKVSFSGSGVYFQILNTGSSSLLNTSTDVDRVITIPANSTGNVVRCIIPNAGTYSGTINIEITSMPELDERLTTVKNDTDFNTECVTALQNNRLPRKFTWEEGWVAGSGVLYNNPYTLRTLPFYVEETLDIEVDIPAGYSIDIWPYTSLPVGSDTYATGTRTITANGTYQLLGNLYYIITFYYGDNTTSFNKSDVNLLKVVSYKNNFSTKRLVGNWAVNVLDKYNKRLNTIADAVLANMTGNTIVFSWMSDLHVGANPLWTNLINHPQVLDQIGRYCGADFTIDTGDVIANTNRADDTKNFYDAWREHYITPLPVLYAKGNHEVWLMSDDHIDVSNATIQGVTQKTVGYMQKSVNALYYYTDIRNARIIVLDTSAIDGYRSGLGPDQRAFLENALATLGDKKAIIMCHIPLDVRANSTIALSDETEVLNILQTYKSKIVAVFHGHNHLDNIVTLDGITYIGICCSCLYQTDPSAVPSGDPKSWPRSRFDITEYCIDTVVCNVASGVIKMFRFGAGQNRTFTP